MRDFELQEVSNLQTNEGECRRISQASNEGPIQAGTEKRMLEWVS